MELKAKKRILEISSEIDEIKRGLSYEANLGKKLSLIQRVARLQKEKDLTLDFLRGIMELESKLEKDKREIWG